MKDYELLEAQARMMRMAEKYGVDRWQKLVQVYWNSEYMKLEADGLYFEFNYKFALGVVEGKPVFEGDTLYVGGNKVFASDSCDLSYAGYTWNSPKPKTGMIELSLDVINYAARNWYEPDKFTVEVGDACRKYLDANQS